MSQPSSSPSSSLSVPEGFVELHQNDFFLLAEHEGRRTVLALRKPGNVMQAEDLATVFQDLMGQIRPEHIDFGLVLDNRASRGNNDESFEAQVKALQAAISGRFRVIVSLVRTAVGRLQNERLNAEAPDGARFHVTTDEAEAYALAAGDWPSP